MNYSNIKAYDVANGPGIRTSLFVSGCTHHCNGCFNEETWDFNSGEKYTNDTKNKLLKQVKHTSGLSLLGGDPFDNLKDDSLFDLVADIKTLYPDKQVWCWTGYTYEQIIKDERMKEFFSLLDVLIDGRFIQSKKDYRLKFKGSTNQRVIDVKETFKQNKIVILEKYNN